MADEELWSTKEVADYIGVTPSTVRVYLSRDEMPVPDFRPASGPLWWASTIKEWHQNRPSQRGER